MSWLDLIISAWRILVNGTEQDVPARVNYIGSVTAAKVGDQLNLTFAAPYNPYAVGIAGDTVLAGGSVANNYTGGGGVHSIVWSGELSQQTCRGIAVNGGALGDPISVQSFGESPPISHALWVSKPLEEHVGSDVYACELCKYTLTKSTTPGSINQVVGSVWYADNEELSDTTILLNIQPPVIVPAS